MKWFRWSYALLAALALGIAVIFGRTFLVSSQSDYQPTPIAWQPNVQALAGILGEAVRYRTISYGTDRPVEGEAFLAFHAFLRARFPLVHGALTRETVNRYSLLYRWPGKDPQDKKPVLLLAHMDVVPISPGTEQDWTAEPFGGEIADGYVWGRGTLDDKLSLIAILGAIEAMLERGEQPQRDIYLAFGHDEEQGGATGAAEIAKVLEARGLEFAFLLDEGGAVIDGILPGARHPVAVIAPAEKGYVTLRLTARAEGGHSSTPPRQSAIGILASAIQSLESQPFPTNFAQSARFLEAIADSMPFGQRLVMKNAWLFTPVLAYMMEQSNVGRAAMHTTTAATVIDGGIKPNVLPISATALVNFRIYPGETPDSVMEQVRFTIADPRVAVGFAEAARAPSPVSPTAGFAWEQLTRAIADTAAPERVAIAPRLLVGATDTYHYRAVAAQQYRFAWLRLTMEDFPRIHGTNERVAVQNVGDAVRFYRRFLGAL